MQSCTRSALVRGHIGERQARGRLTAAAAALAVAGAILAGWLIPATASAGSGVFCSWCDLNPGGRVVGNYRGYFYETETWNSDGKGVGSCTGVGTSGPPGIWQPTSVSILTWSPAISPQRCMGLSLS